jgi:hypothetical protein
MIELTRKKAEMEWESGVYTYDEFYGIKLRVVGISVLSFAESVQELLVDYLHLPPLIGIGTIGAVSGDGIVYVMPDMGDLTLIWEWRLTGATSKSYACIKLSLEPFWRTRSFC